MSSDTDAFAGFFARQHNLKQCPGYKNSREHVRNQTNKESYRESLDRAGAKLKQKGGRNQGGKMGVDQGNEDAVEAGHHRGCGVLARAHFFANSLENQYVR